MKPVSLPLHTTLRGFALLNLVVFPIAIGLPMLLFNLWREAVEQVHFQGGMWYFPTTRDEIFFMGIFFLSVSPFVISMLLFGVPLELGLSLVGFEMQLPFPMLNGQVQIDIGFVLGGIIGIAIQTIVYSLPFYALWTAIAEIRSERK